MYNKPKNYTIYHLHTMLSNGVTNIDSITKYNQYIDTAADLGMKAIAFSEHGNIFEWVHKKWYAESKGLKYIHAVEAYITDDMSTKRRDNYHCVLIAKNHDGVKELNKMISRSFMREDNHFYYEPRISMDELFATSDNIIVTSACLGGVLNCDDAMAKERFLGFLIRNKHRCYLEIQHHNCDEQKKYNQQLYELHRLYDIPMIAGTDTHALNELHMDGRHVLQLAKDVRFENEDALDLTFKSIEELLVAYQEQNSLPMNVVYEAIHNTNKMADMVEEFTLDTTAKYPVLYENAEEVFKQKINDGVISRGIRAKANYPEYVDRIHKEYEVYKHNNAINFMLLEEDYKTYLRRNGIRYGYARGSVSGSIIAYLLYITEMDSVKYHLNFERFMNPERVSLADVDTDFYSEDRKAVREYLYSRHGLYCCDIITFNTIQAKGAIRELCRVFYKDNPNCNHMKIADKIIALYEQNPDAAHREYPQIFKYLDILIGVVVSIGNHPAGVVVSPFPVDDWFGTCTTKGNEYPIAQINMKEIDALNFVKLDILGLDNIGIIDKTCKAVGIDFATPDNIPADDVDVWNSIRDDTTLIFQWGADSAASYLKQLFSDATVAKVKKHTGNFDYMEMFSIGNGVLRPACASFRDDLAAGIFRNHGHPALNEFLQPTLGYLVYQEQVMEFLHQFCGFTMGEADVVRRGFAKKTGTEKFLPKIHEGFLTTMASKYGLTIQESEKLIKSFLRVIEDAGDYLFSKNHADAYSWIGYICGYLRYYYPLEFITAALNVFQNKEQKTMAITDYAQRHNISITPIKFRFSRAEYNFRRETNEIYKGIASIKDLNGTIAEELYALRNNEYDSFVDLLYDIKDKTTAKKNQIDILIKLDYFIEFGDANKLLIIHELFQKYKDKSQVNKSDLDACPFSEDELRVYAGAESEKQFRKIDFRGLMVEKSHNIPNQPINVLNKIRWQIDLLGYCDVVDKKYAHLGVVLDIDTKYSPRIQIYSLKNGHKTEVKTSKQLFNANSMKRGDVIRIVSYESKTKVHKTDNGWEPVEPRVTEWWLKKWKQVEKL